MRLRSDDLAGAPEVDDPKPIISPPAIIADSVSSTRLWVSAGSAAPIAISATMIRSTGP